MVGQRFEVEVGPVAHGGHCVARVSDPALAHSAEGSRVVFVRHALPGERVTIEITEGNAGDRFLRADAVEVLEASPERVDPPCPVAGPGLCGGCDFQHVTLDAQRQLKTDVVREQLVRLGRFDPEDPLVRGVQVEAVPVPGRPDDGLRWRTRTRFVSTPDGHQGLRRHRSHEVVPVQDCLITADSAETGGDSAVEQVTVGETIHEFTRAADGFWQVHPQAPSVLVETVLGMFAAQPGESVLDLYGGVGLFARFLADQVGESGRVELIEGDRAATRHAQHNLGPAASVIAGDVAAVLAGVPAEHRDLVVLDPPRAGAKRAVVEAAAARTPRAIAYVACDPAALARDLATFADHGYQLRELRAFDLFPMTHHVECVALLEKPTQ